MKIQKIVAGYFLGLFLTITFTAWLYLIISFVHNTLDCTLWPDRTRFFSSLFFVLFGLMGLGAGSKYLTDNKGDINS